MKLKDKLSQLWERFLYYETALGFFLEEKKKIVIPLAIILIVVGCTHVVEHWPYQLHQDFDQIVKIEILENEEGGYDLEGAEVLKTLDVSEHRSFIDDLMKLDSSRILGDAVEGFGRYMIRITYRNGDAEIIGEYSNGYITVDGSVTANSYFNINKQFYDFLSEVLGEPIKDRPC